MWLLALERQMAFYQSLGLDMLKDAISVPGLTLRYLFKSLPSQVYFSLIPPSSSTDTMRRGSPLSESPMGRLLPNWLVLMPMPSTCGVSCRRCLQTIPLGEEKKMNSKREKKKMKTTTVRCHESGWSGPCTHKTSTFNTNSTGGNILLVDATYQWTAWIPSTKLSTSFMGVYGTGTHATRPEEKLTTRSMENH